MTHISIVLEEPAFRNLLEYYWHQLPTQEYAVVFVGLFLLQGLAEALSLIAGIRYAVSRCHYWRVNIVLSLAFVLSGGMTGYTLLLTDTPPGIGYWVGLGVFACAYLGRDLTHSLLKAQYASYLERAVNEHLVISGIFALIRYPLAALYLLEMAAFTLIAWNQISATMLVIAFLSIRWKIQREERRLALQCDERFTAYRRTTKRIIPFIY